MKIDLQQNNSLNLKKIMILRKKILDNIINMGVDLSKVDNNFINNCFNIDSIDYYINKSGNLTEFDSNDFSKLNYRFVASNLFLYKIYYEVYQIYYKADIEINLFNHIKYMIDNNYYTKEILNKYSKEQIEVLEKELNFNLDLQHDLSSINHLYNRYLMKQEINNNGNIMKYTLELPQYFNMVLSMMSYINSDIIDDNIINKVKKLYDKISKKKISLATPELLNLRKPKPPLSSCYITKMSDSLESIEHTIGMIAKISKNAGGASVNFSNMRALGSYVKGHFNASKGVISWLKKYDNTLLSYDQLGARKGAGSASLDIWHYDILSFLEIRTENGDMANKCFSIQPQIVIPDLFMKRMLNDDEWLLFCPYEVKTIFNISIDELHNEEFEKAYIYIYQNKDKLRIKNLIKAKDLFKHVLKSIVQTGRPYIFFKDTVNRFNPNKDTGYIGNSNLCTESFSNFNSSNNFDTKIVNNRGEMTYDIGYTHTCDLISLVWSNIDDINDLEECTNISVEILDNYIDIGIEPIIESNVHHNSYRILGLGVMGLHDFLAKNKLLYTNGQPLCEYWMEYMSYFAHKKSNELAIEKGSYPLFEQSEYKKGIILGKDKNWFNDNDTNIDKNKWIELINNIQQNGIRNGSLLAIAPNTSTSLLMGTTASVIPIYNLFFLDQSSGGVVPIVPKYLNKNTRWYYQQNKNIDQNVVLNMVKCLQKWVDQGISTELVFDNNNNKYNAKNLFDIYVNAWKNELKTLYYIRFVSKIMSEDSCVSCAN